jgi:hypothetical protein
LGTRAGVVCKYGSSGLVDELQNLQTGVLGRGLEGILLRIGEVGRNRNDRSVDVLA